MLRTEQFFMMTTLASDLFYEEYLWLNLFWILAVLQRLAPQLSKKWITCSGTILSPPRRVRKQLVNVPSFIVRLDSQKHIDFSLKSPYGGGPPGEWKSAKSALVRSCSREGWDLLPRWVLNQISEIRDFQVLTIFLTPGRVKRMNSKKGKGDDSEEED